MEAKSKSRQREAPPEKRVLTDAAIRKMQGLCGFAPDSVAFWTPEPFTEIDGLDASMWPVLRIRPFDAETGRRWNELALSGQLTDQALREILCKCVVGWENMWDMAALLAGEFVAIPFSKDAIMDSAVFLDKLASLTITKARQLTWGLSDEEKEGLESRQPPASGLPSNPAPSADAMPA